jgi:hypothetical protein
MPTPSSGPISFLNLKNAFGTSNPVPINTLYRGGANVPNISPNIDIATSGQTSLNDYYSAWGNKTLSFTITVGSSTSVNKKKGTVFGYGSGFGSISASSFLTPVGTITIRALYYDTGTSRWWLELGSTSAPPNSDLSFKQASVTGYSIGGVRSAGVSTVVGTSRYWKWSASSAHPISGTITCAIQYYG